MQMRRVVTGHRDGKAVFASDEIVDGFAAGPVVAHMLWHGDQTPSYPDDGTIPPFTTAFPGVGGLRFLVWTMPPEGAASDAKWAESLGDVMEADAPGMHTTATIDFEIVLRGELTLELDDGATVTLRPFDTVVQNGTRHRWRNNGTEPATLAVFMSGAHHTALEE